MSYDYPVPLEMVVELVKEVFARLPTSRAPLILLCLVIRYVCNTSYTGHIVYYSNTAKEQDSSSHIPLPWKHSSSGIVLFF